MSAIRILPFEKRTAFDATGKPVEGKLPEGLCVRYGLKEGALLLLNGVEGRASGFGLEHIQANTGRMKQLSGLGFTSAHMFVRYVFENYTAVSQQPDGRIVLVAERNADYLWVVCQWDPDRLVWSVTTAISAGSRSSGLLGKRVRRPDKSEPCPRSWRPMPFCGRCKLLKPVEQGPKRIRRPSR